MALLVERLCVLNGDVTHAASSPASCSADVASGVRRKATKPAAFGLRLMVTTAAAYGGTGTETSAVTARRGSARTSVAYTSASFAAPLVTRKAACFVSGVPSMRLA